MFDSNICLTCLCVFRPWAWRAPVWVSPPASVSPLVCRWCSRPIFHSQMSRDVLCCCVFACCLQPRASCGTAGTGNWAAGPTMDYWWLGRCDHCRRLQREKVCKDSDCFQEDIFVVEYGFNDRPQGKLHGKNCWEILPNPVTPIDPGPTI